MNNDPTEFQTASGQSASQKLSMQATTPPSDVPGYRLQQFLGAGAFGQVWVGRDLNTGRDVAVKFYLHRGGVNWSLLSREVKNLVQLSADRYVVQVLEVGWDADPPYYVMELVSGGSLEDMLQKRDRLPVNEAVEMFRKMCIGLNRCHAKGVLHCDIKPANILLGDDNEPRLADFGQSRLSNDQTPALGTLFYMAPEQADLNSTPDASWDVYAVGAIMYRMLTGEPPYRSDDLVKQVDTAGSLHKRLERYRESIASSRPPTEHAKRESVDRALARIVSKCLAVDPGDRYANVQQILQDLNRRDSTRTRRPLMLLGIVGPLLVLMATCFFGVRSIKQAENGIRSALRDEAFNSNQLAATFAAKMLEFEIERYYELARSEAAQPEFLESLHETIQNEDVGQLLNEIAEMETPAETQSSEAREKFLDIPVRMKLDALLTRQLGLYSSEEAGRRRLASMFVCDAAGTCIAVAYDQKVKRNETGAGKNFAYRTYFHGGPYDLPINEAKIGEVKPISWTHLSSALASTATRFWKIAVSTPIYFSEDHSEPDALFVVTINLGDFELMQGREGNHVAVLVEARDGPAQGTILQHPLMDIRKKAGSKMEAKFQMSESLMQSLLTGREVFDYRDPLASAVDGNRFAGPWIAAMQPVSLPVQRPNKNGNGDRPEQVNAKADLLVLVQYRLSKVFEPVSQLRVSLLWEGAAAIISILVVTLTLWLFVRRVRAPSRERTEKKEATIAVTETMPLK